MTKPNFKLTDYISFRPTTRMDLVLYILAIGFVVFAAICWFSGSLGNAKLLAGMAVLNVIVVCIKDPRQERQINAILSRINHNEIIQRKREERLRRRPR